MPMTQAEHASATASSAASAARKNEEQLSLQASLLQMLLNSLTNITEELNTIQERLAALESITHGQVILEARPTGKRHTICDMINGICIHCGDTE